MRALLMCCLAGLLLGCAGPQVDDYVREQPRLELKDYFSGELQAWGTVLGWWLSVSTSP